jgi:hypothetical protein
MKVKKVQLGEYRPIKLSFCTTAGILLMYFFIKKTELMDVEAIILYKPEACQYLHKNHTYTRQISITFSAGCTDLMK